MERIAGTTTKELSLEAARKVAAKERQNPRKANPQRSRNGMAMQALAGNRHLVEEKMMITDQLLPMAADRLSRRSQPKEVKIQKAKAKEAKILRVKAKAMAARKAEKEMVPKASRKVEKVVLLASRKAQRIKELAAEACLQVVRKTDQYVRHTSEANVSRGRSVEKSTRRHAKSG